MKSTVRLSGIAAALMGLGLVAAPAHAQVFVGGTIGESDIGDYEFGATDFNRDSDDSDTAFHVFLGYQFNDFVAVTAGYADLGALEVSASIDGGEGGDIPYTDRIEATAMDFSVIGILPFSVFAGDDSFLSRISLFGQVGMQFWNQDVDCVACDGGSNFRGGDSGTDVVYGGGLNVNITDNLGVHARFASYPDIGGTETGHEQDWDMWGLGATWSFGN